MRTLGIAILLLLSLIGGEGASFAQGGGTSFALIVTNNRSTRLSRPDLRYADDDGAKYYEVFRMIAPESNVALLTTFDHDTERLFPELVGKTRAPSKSQVLSAAGELARLVAAAREKGPVDFYFVFAGHGDVDNGKGFLELSDGAFTSDDLEALLRSIPATRSHVILDSCNSFFVINARKPGGRHFVTSEEATKSLSERLPNVGVFLSTSAEAEVYEWSELQSGVFSHAVRSGLAGAADANGDGRISYDELRAFVNTASNNITNPLYRPQVFARAPNGLGSDAIFSVANAQGVRLRLDETQRRITVRDRDDLRWVDVHKEAGQPLTLFLPARLAANASVDEKDSSNAAVVRRYGMSLESSPSDVLLAALPPRGVGQASARGPDDMFGALFSRPFGPQAFARFQRESATEEPLVFGVSEDDKRRMRDLLEVTADRRRIERYTNGLLLGGMGVLVGASGAYAYSLSFTTAGKALAGSITGLGGALAIGGVIAAFVPTREEVLFRHYVEGVDQSKSSMQLALTTEHDLFALATRNLKIRHVWRGFSLSLAGVFLAAGALDISQTPKNDGLITADIGLGGIALAFGTAFALTYVKSPAEQAAELWAKDPSLGRLPRTPTFTIEPQIGLGTVGLAGTF